MDFLNYKKELKYNKIHIDNSENKEVKIASIDTILSFYLAFIYANKPYFNTERLLCMSKFLFDVEEKNRLQQKGLLKRFSIDCYGHQDTIEEIRSQKTNKFKELMKNRNSKEYEAWFLKYNPGQKLEGKEKIQDKLKNTVKTDLTVIKKTKTLKKKKRDSDYLV